MVNSQKLAARENRFSSMLLTTCVFEVDGVMPDDDFLDSIVRHHGVQRGRPRSRRTATTELDPTEPPTPTNNLNLWLEWAKMVCVHIDLPLWPRMGRITTKYRSCKLYPMISTRKSRLVADLGASWWNIYYRFCEWVRSRCVWPTRLGCRYRFENERRELGWDKRTTSAAVGAVAKTARESHFLHVDNVPASLRDTKLVVFQHE